MEPRDAVSSGLSACQTLDREFLQMRAWLLQVAASWDRIDRAEGDVGDDPRWGQICQAVATLTADRSDRARRLQEIFSLPYDPQWRNKYGI
ncbi:MAG: hypothetical protein R3E01_21260 [Pirellulaceae bacterium]|nr:hypothetical protein [Planctomycetales bacterium]